MTQAQIHAASHEWYGDTAPAHLAMARARLGAGEKPDSWRQG